MHSQLEHVYSISKLDNRTNLFLRRGRVNEDLKMLKFTWTLVALKRESYALVRIGLDEMLRCPLAFWPNLDF